MIGTVTSEEMQAAQIITGATMAVVIGVRFVPSLAPYVRTIRLAALACYLLACGVFVAVLLIRN